MADDTPQDNVDEEEQTLKVVEMNPVMSDSERDALSEEEEEAEVANEPVQTVQSETPAATPDSPESPEERGLINTASPSDTSSGAGDVEKRIEAFKKRTKSLPPTSMAPSPTDSPKPKPNPLLRTSTPKSIAPKPPSYPDTTSQTVLMADDKPIFHDLSHVACFLSFFLFWTVFAVLSFIKAKSALTAYRNEDWEEYKRLNKRSRQFMVASVGVAMVVLIIVVICVVAIDASSDEPDDDVPDNPI